MREFSSRRENGRWDIWRVITFGWSVASASSYFTFSLLSVSTPAVAAVILVWYFSLYSDSYPSSREFI